MSETNNVVTMSNGETLDFGKQGKCFSSFDVETGLITFKLVTGEVIELSLDSVPENVQRMALLSGLLKKVTITIPSVEDVKDLAAKVQGEVDKLVAGKFTVRGSGQGAAELDDFMVAFAIVNAIGKIETSTGSFVVPQAFIAVDDLRPEWVDVQSPKVIDEVLAFWDSLTAKEKTWQKRNNNYVGILKGLIEDGTYTV